MDILIEYRDLVLEYPNYVDLTIDGLLGLPELETNDLPYSNRDGFLPGVDKLRGKAITISGTINAFDQSTFQTAVQNLRFAFEPREFETFLLVTLPGLADGQQVGIGCRPRRGAEIVDVDYDNWSATFSVELFATDSYFYDTSYSVVNMTTTGDLNGHGFDLSFNHGFGGGTTSAFIAINNGNANSWPIISFFGPMVGPHVINQNDSGNGLSFDIDIATGQVLEVDAKTRQVILTGPANRYNTIVDSDWFRILPGNNTLTFTVDSSTGSPSATVRFRSAWI